MNSINDPSFPTHFTPFIRKMLPSSAAFRKQFLFTPLELQDAGTYKPWHGVFDTGIRGLERMYVNRCILLPVNTCPAYCRFCVRKDYLAPAEKEAMSEKDLEEALRFIQHDTRLVEVLISGGEAIMNLRRLKMILSGLGEIKHVRVIRFATRCVAYDPDRISAQFLELLDTHQDRHPDQKIEIETHFDHPDEIQPETRAAAKRLLDKGFSLVCKTTLLRGINDDAETLRTLFQELRFIGIQPYYLVHCTNPRGAAHFRTTVDQGLQLKRALRGMGSGRSNPQYILLTSVGKVEPGVDATILGKEGKMLVIETPYRPEQFDNLMLKAFQLPQGAEISAGGYLIVRYPDGEPERFPSPQDPGVSALS